MSRVSVVIPAFEAADTLAECLAGLSLSERQPDEVIVVDDGSGGEQAGRMSALVAQYGGRFLRQPNGGPAAARNHGAREAAGDVIAFLDADVRVHPSTLGQLEAALADPQVDAAFGSYDDRPDGGSVVSDFRNLLHHYVHQHSRREASTFWAGCGVVRRSVFAATGFDESYKGASIEDVAYGIKLKALGHRIELRPEIQATHLKRWTPGSFLRTDLFGRAIPWTRMMLGKGGGLPPDLNFGWGHQASTLLAGLVPLMLLLAIRLPVHGLAGAAACLLLLAWLNRGFLGFLARLRGVAFALRAFPFHIAHYFAGGLGFAAGAMAEWRHRDRHAWWVAAALAGVALAIQLASGAYGADFNSEPDEASHFVGGVLVAQYLERPSPASPMAFAENFYLHYPRFAIGHWPPGLYLLEGAWFAFWGGTRAAALVLQALIAFLLVLSVYVCVRLRTPVAPALAAALLLLVSGPLQRALGATMADSLTAVIALGAALAFARYLARPSLANALLFGLLAAMAMLTKGSAAPLLAVPALAILVARRFELLLRFDLWATALPVLLLAAPWYVFARSFDSPNHENLWHPRLLMGLTSSFDYPAVILLAALAAVLLLVKREPMVAALVALLAGYVLAPLAVPHFNDSRHLLPAAAAASVLAGRVLGRFPVWVTGVALASLLLHGGIWLSHPQATIRPWIANFGGAERVMLAGSADGAVVAAMAEHRPRGGPIVLRSSRVLADSNWGGNFYTLRIQDVDQTRERLKQLGVGLVLLPETPLEAWPHEKLLQGAVEGWLPQPAPSGLRVYLSPEKPPLPPLEIQQKRLRRSIQLRTE